MAPGANYMGGKRNAARARSKDMTKRTHKNFFSRQRLDILSKGLSGRIPSGGKPSGLGPRVSASDISLSHARHLAPRHEDQNHIPMHSPADVSSPSRSPPAKPRNRSHIRSSSGSRSSKILEALDTTERKLLPTDLRIQVNHCLALAMRAAMIKILSIPDLAGLSTHQSSHVHTPSRTGSRSKRTRPIDLETFHPQDREQKRQKTRIAQSCSPSDFLQQDQNFEYFDRFESMDVEGDENEDYTMADEGDDCYFEPENGSYDPDVGNNTVQSSPPSDAFRQPDNSRPSLNLTLFPKNPPSTPVRHHGTKLLPAPPKYPFVSLSSHSAGFVHNPLLTSPFKQNNHNTPNTKEIVLRANLYDYQDPWSAIGVILGLEKDQGARDKADCQESSRTSVAEIQEVESESQHFHDTLSSNSDGSSSYNHHSTFPLYAEEVGHFDSPTAPASPASQSESNGHHFSSGNAYLADFPIDSTHKLEDLQCHASPEVDVEPESLSNNSKDDLDESNPPTPTSFENLLSPRDWNESNPDTHYPLDESEPLANSKHHLDESNPATPTSIKSRPLSPRDVSDGRRETSTLLLCPVRSSPQPQPKVEFTGVERLPKFAKFPSPLNLKRTPAHTSTYIRPVPPIQSSQSIFTSSLPPFSHKLESLASRSPSQFSFGRLGRQDDRVEPRRKSPDTERIFKIDRVEVGRIGNMQNARPADRFEDVAEETANTEVDGSVPERFFGDLCLFTDDIDASESDD
ncbi:hypothetical protein B0H19DRAFT_1120075 [Mycena capillaripes]|nr:hypothetical protein B0H19DRAFT_1120075 [Mycena capillaripes]